MEKMNPMGKLDPMDVLLLLKHAVPLVKAVSRMHGKVHKRAAVEINGVKGFLVWDYILYNEITFDDMDGKIYSFFTSPSDEETEAEWNKLVQKHGV